MAQTPSLSVVLATRNRKDILLTTLRNIRAAAGDRGIEIIVVDNASTDGSGEALKKDSSIQLISLKRNAGSCAKALGAEQACGDILFFLDDDAYPTQGTLENTLRHFTQKKNLGAAGCVVRLPDGRRECGALPHVFVGCGVAVRAQAYHEVGGWDRSFFMQAEEYDLAFRLLGAHWEVEIFPDLQVEHLKTDVDRRSARTTYLDVRNNLRLIDRYLSPPFRTIYRRDWIERYGWLARRQGYSSAFYRGLFTGKLRGALERRTYENRRLSAVHLEKLFRWADVRARMEALSRLGVRRILLDRLGKNVFAFYKGAVEAGLTILGVCDDRFAAPGRLYRQLPILSTEQALRVNCDAIVIGDMAYAHAARRAEELKTRTEDPIYNWFRSPTPSDAAHRPTEVKTIEAPLGDVTPDVVHATGERTAPTRN